MAEAPKDIYPKFHVENNKNPNRWLNFPLAGILTKFILLIPVFIELLFLNIASLVLLIITWFIVLFSGKYWDTAYTFFVGIIKLETKVILYLYGITDKYPGYTFNAKGFFELTLDKPEKPKRWLAIPFIGIIVRLILLIPYLIFLGVMENGARLAVFLSWFVILFKKRLPESLYEFERDNIRVSIAASAYLIGLSDKYPSFYISMNHQTAKILLLLAGASLSFSNWGSSDYEENKQYQNNEYDYRVDYTPDSNFDIDYDTR